MCVFVERKICAESSRGGKILINKENSTFRALYGKWLIALRGNKKNFLSTKNIFVS